MLRSIRRPLSLAAALCLTALGLVSPSANLGAQPRPVVAPFDPNRARPVFLPNQDSIAAMPQSGEYGSYASLLSDGARPGTVPDVVMRHPPMSALGRRALAIKPYAWKHAETDCFYYHYFYGPSASKVATEAEYYYWAIADDLGRPFPQGEKCHIFIFEDTADWRTFAAQCGWPNWASGCHVGHELFVPRKSGFGTKCPTLCHEIAHLVLERTFGRGLPMWLDEGYAQFVSGQSHFGTRIGTNRHGKSQSWIPLDRLTAATTYPADIREAVSFYRQSEQVVRYLTAVSKPAFIKLVGLSQRGVPASMALAQAYGPRFPEVAALEREYLSSAPAPRHEWRVNQPGNVWW